MQSIKAKDIQSLTQMPQNHLPLAIAAVFFLVVVGRSWSFLVVGCCCCCCCCCSCKFLASLGAKTMLFGICSAFEYFDIYFCIFQASLLRSFIVLPDIGEGDAKRERPGSGKALQQQVRAKTAPETAQEKNSLSPKQGPYQEGRRRAETLVPGPTKHCVPKPSPEGQRGRRNSNMQTVSDKASLCMPVFLSNVTSAILVDAASQDCTIGLSRQCNLMIVMTSLGFC